MNNIDCGSLKNKGFFDDRVVFGTCVSIVDALLLQMKERHSE